MNTYAENEVVTFGKYQDDVDDKDRLFESGDQLRIVEVTNDPDGIEYSVKRESDGSEGFVFPNELEVAEPEVQADTTYEEKSEADTVEVEVAKKSAKKTAKKASKKSGKQVAKASEESETPEIRATVSDLVESLGHLDAAKVLVDRVGETYFDLGKVLADIYSNELYKELEIDGKNPYDQKKGFALYVDEILKVHYRKAMDLIHIYQFFSDLGYVQKDVVSIGWSKAREISRLSGDSIEDVKALMKFAETHTRDELKAEVSEKYVDTSEDGRSNKTKFTTFKISVAEDRALIVHEALEQAATVTGSDDINENFMYVMQLFVENATTDAGSEAYQPTQTVDSGESQDVEKETVEA